MPLQMIAKMAWLIIRLSLARVALITEVARLKCGQGDLVRFSGSMSSRLHNLHSELMPSWRKERFHLFRSTKGGVSYVDVQPPVSCRPGFKPELLGRRSPDVLLCDPDHRPHH